MDPHGYVGKAITGLRIELGGHMLIVGPIFTLLLLIGIAVIFVWSTAFRSIVTAHLPALTYFSWPYRAQGLRMLIAP